MKGEIRTFQEFRIVLLETLVGLRPIEADGMDGRIFPKKRGEVIALLLADV